MAERDDEETQHEDDELDSGEEELEDEDSDDEEYDSDDDDSDDDDADDDDSDDDADADDDDADDDDADDDDADDAPRQGKAARPRRKAGGKKRKTGRRRTAKERPTAGARLAAARAAKAARKAAQRGVEKKEEEAPVEVDAGADLSQRAQQAANWTAANQQMVIGVVAAVLLAVGGFIGWHYYSKGQNQAAGEALAAAVELSQAQLRGEDEDPPEEDEPATFTSADARAEAALEAFQGVISSHGGSDAVGWAHLGAGNALTELERYDDARTSFDAAVAQGGTDSAIVWRALEGKGFTYEAEEAWGQALEAYQELSRLDSNRYESVAQYHIARMYIAQGETEQATETLTEVVNDLREAEDDEDAQGFAYVLAQAEIRLRELDPSAVPARPTLNAPPGGPGGGGGANPLEGMSPEQIQEFIRQMQQKQAGGE
ncbi:MAG: hypothetical protein AB8I08_39840 [Sandaracinaceae bacterium]